MKLLKIILASIAVVQLAAYSAGPRGAQGVGPGIHRGMPMPGTDTDVKPSLPTYPQFTPLPLVGNKQWYRLQLAANSTQGYIVAWDAVSQSSQCLATIAIGGTPVAPNCRRPPIDASNQDLVGLINLQGQQDAKRQLIGILTCNSPDYVKAWGQVNPNNSVHWCNVVDAQLNPKFIKVPPEANIKFPILIPYLPINGQWWSLLQPSSTSTQWFLVSWDPASGKGQCLATIAGQGDTATAECLRPPLTASLAELNNLLQRKGQRDEQQKLISTLVCGSPQYVRTYGQVDPNNQDQWCNMIQVRLNPNPPPLTTEEKTQLSNTIKRMEDSGQYPILDRSSSLAGTDANNNGVRDDVEAYINKTWTDPKENKAVMQFARGQQSRITTDLKDKATVKRVDDQDTDAINCLGDTFVDKTKGQKAFDEIITMTFNTMARTRAASAFDKARDGAVISIPQRNTCEK